MDNITIPKNAAICAAMHYIGLHEADKRGLSVSWAESFACENCPILLTCRGQWIDTTLPLFDAVRLWPNLVIGEPPLLSGREDS